ncbi:MAG: adenylate/guanylate cyclase domain-containing protein [Alphaproteobacteria bacterium]|nr:adenylate/guanylate cyclase domain-containing protein [Alphaproteobacteria bacterium]
MPADREAAIREITDWAVAQALCEVDMERLFTGVCDRLSEAGIPIRRAHLAVRTLHPLVEAVGFRWWRGQAPEQMTHRRTEEPSLEWEQSPLKRLEESGDTELRISLEGEAGEWRDFPLLVDLRNCGITDYYCRLSFFGSEARARRHQDGMIVSWSTDQPGGFSDDDLAALRRVQDRLAVGVKMAKREQTALNVLTAYLGADAGRRVLEGQIQRGDGELLHAVIWYSDLRGSTPLADRIGGVRFLALLNDYFECTASAVLDHGGEVLRFIGDAVLAIFKVEGPGGEQRAARMAMAAAKDAEKRLERLNEKRALRNEEPLDFGLALHVGEVLFGNVGVPERFDFTAVGPAVNEAARLEGLTKTLERRIVVSNAFSSLLPLEWESLGETALRGVETGRRVYAPPLAE